MTSVSGPAVTVISLFLTANLALIQASAALVVGAKQAPDYLGAAWVHLTEAGRRRLDAGKTLDETWLKYCTADAVKAALREERGQYKTRDPLTGRTVTAVRLDARTFTDIGVSDEEVERATPVASQAGDARDRDAARRRTARAGESAEQKEARLVTRRTKYAQRARHGLHDCS
jgi:hypothetical protein